MGRRALTAIIIGFGILLCPVVSFSVKANEADLSGEVSEENMTTEYSRIVTAVGAVDAREEPDENAAVTISYHIYVTEQTAGGWYRVRYQDLTGYVRREQVAEIELDVEALDEEFAVEEAEGKLVVEEVERQRTEVRRSRIWGAVIILLVLGVYATGIITAAGNGAKGADRNERD